MGFEDGDIQLPELSEEEKQRAGDVVAANADMKNIPMGSESPMRSQVEDMEKGKKESVDVQGFDAAEKRQEEIINEFKERPLETIAENRDKNRKAYEKGVEIGLKYGAALKQAEHSGNGSEVASLEAAIQAEDAEIFGDVEGKTQKEKDASQMERWFYVRGYDEGAGNEPE